MTATPPEQRSREAPPLRLPLRLKWIAALLLVSVAPLLVLSLQTVRIQRAGLEIAEKNAQVAVIERATGVIERRLDEVAAATRRVGRLLTEARITNEDARLSLSREALEGAPAIDSVAIYRKSGELLDAIVLGDRVRAAPPPVLPKELRLQDGVEVAGGLWLPPEPGAAGVVLRYGEAMVRDGQLRGYVLGSLAPGALRGELSALSEQTFGRPDQVLLLDEGLRVLVSGGGGALAEQQVLAGRDLFAKIAVPPRLFQRPFGLTTEFSDSEGRAMVGTLQSLPSRRLGLLVRRPAAEAMQALAASRRALLLSGVGFTLLAVLLGIFFAARVTRPIAALLELTRAYARRDFGRRSPVATGDELQVLGEAMTDMATQLREGEAALAARARVEANLSRYVPAQLARQIAEGGRALDLGGERRTITVLFADLVSFTPFAESAPPERVAALLNELFGVLTEVVFRHGGTVDKFLGDCVMALFGAIDGEPGGGAGAEHEHAARALRAAEDMHRFVEATGPAWKETYGLDARLAIGVHTGPALVGNLGSEVRMEFTAIGDVVNVAARLEALAQPGQTLLTEQVAAAAAEAGFAVRALGSHPLRGKSQPVEVLELL